ncbi:hypothetical protein CBR_g29397 [Chara braunii]|uniref:Uncharacterized protein n=1 Tax=Chara braunii TaxID=69332 RepID=A0A388JWP6_CHABU|nr:hypothetical protein CBR_g29397 [Chara braunii]|eukprot:GBG62198.1 hypothetical protein CBR_g29397 [Chara braunii]
MDLATLSSVLQMATSQNPEERKLGEDRLVQGSAKTERFGVFKKQRAVHWEIVLTDGGRRMKPLKDSSTLQSGSLRQRCSIAVGEHSFSAASCFVLYLHLSETTITLLLF